MKVNKIFMESMVLAVFLVGGMVQTPIAEAASKKYLSLGTGNPGGTFYFLGAGFAQIFNKYDPSVRVIAESTAASEENFNLILRQKMDLGLCGLEVIPSALAKKRDLTGVRLFAMGHSSDAHWIVRKESRVKTFEDFKGRKVAVGAPGSGTLIISKDVLSDVFGVKFEDFKPAYLTFSESVTGIKDGTIDVGLVVAGFPVASVLDLAQNHPIRLISSSPEEINRLTRERPYLVKIVFPAKTYKGIEEEVTTYGSVAGLFCRADLSEDLIYSLIKNLYDHPKERDAIHPQARQWSLENMYRATGYVNKYIPFHPGAVRYLKEKGVWREK